MGKTAVQEVQGLIPVCNNDFYISLFAFFFNFITFLVQNKHFCFEWCSSPDYYLSSEYFYLSRNNVCGWSSQLNGSKKLTGVNNTNGVASTSAMPVV